MNRNTIVFSASIGALAAIALGLGAGYAIAQQHNPKTSGYSYATKGLVEFQDAGEHWKLLLDASNLGGRELDMLDRSPRVFAISTLYLRRVSASLDNGPAADYNVRNSFVIQSAFCPGPV